MKKIYPKKPLVTNIFFTFLILVSNFLHSYTITLFDSNNVDKTYSLLDSNSYTFDLNTERVRAFNLRFNPDNITAAKVEFYINSKLINIDESADNSGFYHLYQIGNEWLPGPGYYSFEVKTLNASNLEIDSVSFNLQFSDALAHRMRTVKIGGLPANAVIDINMLQHYFPFGSMIEYKENLTEEITPEYLGTFVENFNYTVPGNVGKWYYTQPDWWQDSPHGGNGSPYAGNLQRTNQHRLDALDDWLTRISDLETKYDMNIGVRGHTLLWGAKSQSDQSYGDHMHDPNWVEAIVDLNGNGILDNAEKIDENFEELLYFIKQRIQTVVGQFKDRISEWDFNNELLNADFYTEFLGEYVPLNYDGRSMYKLFSDWALEADPNIKLWYNDYGIIASGNENNANAFKALLQNLIDEGVPVDGIGLEGHFGSPNAAANASRIKSILDNLSTLGVPIKVTEFDTGWEAAGNVSASTEAQEANALEACYRTCFEHPSVNGIIMWGFWETEHWKPYRAAWNADWTETLQASRFRSLVWNEWHSDAQVVSNSEGVAEFSVFAGDFDITIEGSTIRESITPDNSSVKFYQYSSGTLSETQAINLELISPTNRESFYESEPIQLSASVSSGNVDDLDYVDFFINDVLFKRDSVPPFTAKWYDAPEGLHNLKILGKTVSLFEDELENISIQVGEWSFDKLENSGFENVSSGSTILNWISRGSSNIFRTSAHAFEGTYSARVSGRTAKWHGIAQDVTDKLVHGDEYKIICYVKTDQAQTLQLQLRVVDSNNAQKFNNPYTNFVEADQWTKLEYTTTYDDKRNTEVNGAPFVTDRVYITVNSYSNNIASFYVDKFYIGEQVDYSSDTNLNGIPDTWEEESFNIANPFVSGSFDSDGDGVSNLIEWRQGTDPIDSDSKFSFSVTPRFSSSQDRLIWTGSSSKAYKILTKTSLLDSSDWTIDLEGYSGSNDKFIDITHQDASEKFFKIVIDE